MTTAIDSATLLLQAVGFEKSPNEAYKLLANLADQFGTDFAGRALIGLTSVDALPTIHRVHLLGVGDKKINVIKVVREFTGWGLKDAKDFVENVVDRRVYDTDIETASRFVEALRESGAIADSSIGGVR